VKRGVLGGTFDPPHRGHLELARAAIEAFDLDEVLFVPANKNPLKQRRRMIPAKHRLAMTTAMIMNEPKMAVCDIEILRGGPSYAVDTLTELTFAEPGEYWFIVGADAAMTLADWKQPERMLRLCRLAVAVRAPLRNEDFLARIPADLRDRVDIIPFAPTDVSSTEIRDALEVGRPPGTALPPVVYAYIKQNSLYKHDSH
jgi:nicotinate-nucleotide adenylyltransferase